ncbi:hypothetical protein [Streptomyces sp. FH025]|uniref:hypothetical protein n=1 Tax=Streptomyces sp. FH025 TaxID=2815937 RepID=UPI001A9EBB21|nr:hypothetical protein [Streptomyces sp. FH025]MBO1413063.1 hypothetical protein [Streptomyces sp. FH025]
MPVPHSTDVHATVIQDLRSLREDVVLDSGPDGLRVRTPGGGEVRVRGAGRLVRELLWRMSLGPVLLENVLDAGPWPEEELAEAERVLAALGDLVIHSLAVDGFRVLLSVVPTERGSSFRPSPILPEAPLRLSRFAVLRTDGTDFLLESPRAPYRVELHRPEALYALGSLARAALPSKASAASAARSIPSVVVLGVLRYLVAAGMLVVAGPDGAGFAEDTTG